MITPANFACSYSEARWCARRTSERRSHQSLLFIGDSRLQVLYNQTLNTMPGLGTKVGNRVLPSPRSSARFVWAPFVDEIMRKAIDDAARQPQLSLPSTVVVSSGTWAMKREPHSETAFAEFKKNLTDMVPSLETLAHMTRVVWMMQDPVLVHRLSSNWSTLRNSEIAKYNDFEKVQRLYLSKYRDAVKTSRAETITV